MKMNEPIIIAITTPIVGFFLFLGGLLYAAESGSEYAKMTLGFLSALLVFVVAALCIAGITALMFTLNTRENIAMQNQDIEMLKQAGRASYEQQRAIAQMVKTQQMLLESPSADEENDDDGWVIEGAFADIK